MEELSRHLFRPSAPVDKVSFERLLSGSNVLNYQLYSDSARSVVWGSYFWGSRLVRRHLS
ncbi:spore coat U domain-containing protein [Mesorhizobium sp. M0018]|uniref:spore coat protein U domain-containing protein n=1 Tax=Mesorhizobium sp. M0018 TaxID=2956844 RepID=UPI003335E880